MKNVKVLYSQAVICIRKLSLLAVAGCWLAYGSTLPYLMLHDKKLHQRIEFLSSRITYLQKHPESFKNVQPYCPQNSMPNAIMDTYPLMSNLKILNDE